MRAAHDARVARIAAEVAARARARGAAGGFVSLGKASVSHFVPDPDDPRHRDRKIDVRDLREIIELDPAGRTCTAEPGVTFDDLSRATLEVGLIPKLVPELKTITLGGAVSGCSVESMSFKFGGFHDGCLEYEVISGTGEVIRCSREREREVFEMMHGSYGTLGIISKLRFELVPAAPFVRLEHRLHSSFESFAADLEARVAARDADFIDGIIHGPRALVLVLGRFAERAPRRPSDYTFLDIYYRSTLERREDWLTTRDYLFRYDTECHWLTETIPGLTTKPVRLLAGKFLLGSTNLLRWSERLRPLLRYRKHPPVVVDLFIPRRRFADFFAWYAREVDFYPLWIVPYRMAEPYAWIAPGHAARIGDDLVIDCAIYGKRNDDPARDWNRILEDMTYELGGVKTLISKNCHDEATFWTIYDRDRYNRVKARLDPQNLFRGLYEKFHRAPRTR